MTTNPIDREQAVEVLRSMKGWRMPPGEGDAITAALDLAIAALQAQASTEAWRDLAIANGDIVDEIRDVVGLKGKPGDVVEAVRKLAALRDGEDQQPAAGVGEEIMVDTPYDVFILPLRPSGLDGNAPRFVVHVPGPEQPAGDGCHCATCTCEPNMTPAVRFDLSPAQKEGAIREHLIRLGWTPPDEHALLKSGVGDAQLEALDRELAEASEALRAEVEEWKRVAAAQAELHDEAERCAEELARALAGLITWFPSADTYRRLGFDPAAPMRALERAKLALGMGGLSDD